MGYFNLDISTDNQYFDNEETISYFVKTADGTFASAVSIPNCLRRAQRRIIEMGGDRTEYSELTWHLWKANMPSTLVPKYGDNIQDVAGITWVVLQYEYTSWLTRYPCHCKRLGVGVG